ncbi:transporter substrate-binding domain-containing protein [Ensifer aridi]|nr:transporter substrate-binding domain-containing protein [Ensifer aridi]
MALHVMLVFSETGDGRCRIVAQQETKVATVGIAQITDALIVSSGAQRTFRRKSNEKGTPMKRQKCFPLGLASVVAISFLSAGALYADDLQTVRDRGELLVGTEMQYAPYDFLEDGKQVGFNPDLFAEIGKEMKVKVTFSDLPWPSVLPGLEAHKFDIVAGPVSITKERAERYHFTSPIGESAFNLLKQAKDDKLNKIEDIAGKTVGGLRSEVSLDELKTLAASLPEKAEVREYVDSSQGNADLAAGRIVAFANQTSNNGYTAALRPKVFAIVPGTFGELRYVGYVGRKDPESDTLIAAVNDAIAAIKKDGRFAKLQKKWFGSAKDLPAVIDPTRY